MECNGCALASWPAGTAAVCWTVVALGAADAAWAAGMQLFVLYTLKISSMAFSTCTFSKVLSCCSKSWQSSAG